MIVTDDGDNANTDQTEEEAERRGSLRFRQLDFIAQLLPSSLIEFCVVLFFPPANLKPKCTWLCSPWSWISRRWRGCTGKDVCLAGGVRAAVVSLNNAAWFYLMFI